MTFFGRGTLLAYHLPVLGLRSQRNSNPRNAKLAPGSVIVTRRVFSALSDTPIASGLLADALQRSVGPLSPLWGVGREHDHVVQVSGIGDGVASSVEGVVKVVEREVREEWRQR
jgi:hypothetical protein